MFGVTTGNKIHSSLVDNLNSEWAEEKLKFMRPLQYKHTSQLTDKKLPPLPKYTETNMQFKKWEKKKTMKIWRRFLYYMLIFFFLCRVAPVAYGSSQAKGRIGAVTAGLPHSHDDTGSEPHLQPSPPLVAASDPEPTERGQGLNPRPHGCLRPQQTSRVC